MKHLKDFKEFLNESEKIRTIDDFYEWLDVYKDDSPNSEKLHELESYIKSHVDNAVVLGDLSEDEMEELIQITSHGKLVWSTKSLNDEDEDGIHHEDLYEMKDSYIFLDTYNNEACLIFDNSNLENIEWLKKNMPMNVIRELPIRQELKDKLKSRIAKHKFDL